MTVTHTGTHTATTSGSHADLTSVGATDRALLFDAVSLLLTYPDEELRSAVPDLASAVATIEHDEVRDLVQTFLAWFRGIDPLAVEEQYVRTFDRHRRTGLYLTYYLHDDADEHHLALLTLKLRYRAHGLKLVPGELPDLLPVVLEFAATVGPGAGEAALREHRRGLELLRDSLEECDSPYRFLLEAVTRAIPLADADRRS